MSFSRNMESQWWSPCYASCFERVVGFEGRASSFAYGAYGNDGMGYKTFVCVESVAFDSVALPAGSSWEAELKLIPTAL